MRRSWPSVSAQVLAASLLAGIPSVASAGGALAGQVTLDVWDLPAFKEPPPECGPKPAPRIRGLLVGVGTYLASPDGGPAPRTSDAASQNPATLRDALVAAGAKREDVVALVDEAATEQATAEAMQRIVRATTCQDVVVLSFSGRTRSSSSEVALLLHDDVRYGRPLRPSLLRRFVSAIRNRRAFAFVLVDASGTEQLDLTSSEPVWRWTPRLDRELSPDAGDFAGAYAGALGSDLARSGAPAVGLLSYAFATVLTGSRDKSIRSFARAMQEQLVRVRGSGTDAVFEASDPDIAPFLLGASRKRGVEVEEAPVPAVAPGKQYALVIGNWDYRELEPLTTPHKDVQDVSALLRDRFGFELKLPAAREGERPVDLVLRNATGVEIKKALNQLRRVGPDDSVLVYYAGHGYWDDKIDQAYWQGVDAEKGDASLWVSSSDVVDTLKKINARHVLLVSDSCFANKMARRGDKSEPKPPPDTKRNSYINAVLARMSRHLIASGANEPVADGGGEGHSIFAQQFLRWLKEYDQDQFLASELTVKLRESVNGKVKQLPAILQIEAAGGDGGDFVFFRSPAPKQ